LPRRGVPSFRSSRRPGGPMKPSTSNQAKGTLHKLKGAAKEAVGRLTNDPDLEAEGMVEKVQGKVQKKVGQIGKVFGQ
jgi:uncharacterized protein YjbJ (UPF0337 family)